MATAYDQRYVRHEERGFYSLSRDEPICKNCGDRTRCSIYRGLEYQHQVYGVHVGVNFCPIYQPVISFVGNTGIERGTFNTFRRGPGASRRCLVKTRVRLYDNVASRFVADGKVVESVAGPLGDMLERHASMNHLMKHDADENSPKRLHDVLIKLYGRNYSALEEVYSVIYVEVVE